MENEVRERSIINQMFNSQVGSAVAAVATVAAVAALVLSPPGQVDRNEFIDASRLVYY